MRWKAQRGREVTFFPINARNVSLLYSLMPMWVDNLHIYIYTDSHYQFFKKRKITYIYTIYIWSFVGLILWHLMCPSSSQVKEQKFVQLSSSNLVLFFWKSSQKLRSREGESNSRPLGTTTLELFPSQLCYLPFLNRRGLFLVRCRLCFNRFERENIST